MNHDLPDRLLQSAFVASALHQPVHGVQLTRRVGLSGHLLNGGVLLQL